MRVLLCVHSDEAEARTSSVSAEHKHEDEVPKSETKR